MAEITKNPAIAAEYQRRLNLMLPGKSRSFIKAVWDSFSGYAHVALEYRWSRCYYFDAMHKAYQELCGYSASACKTFDEFFCPRLASALKSYFGKEEAVRIREECAMAMEFPYSHNVYRPSYRSGQAGDYADVFFMAMVNAIDFACYGLSVAQSLTTRDALLSGLDHRIALALRHGDQEIFALIEEAVLGDNSVVFMSNLIISAIVKSGEPQALELLGKLLLAAKGQEGLRQAILETCDSGTIESHIFFIKLILEQGLCRFSSVVRAFDTWSGLGFGDQKQKIAEKCMALALKYLSDAKAIQSGLDSNDTTEIYLALWALCCRDLHSAAESSLRLIAHPDKYKRLVGWYFVTNTNEEAYRHALAVRRLGVRDPEELAWVCANLSQPSGMHSWGWSEKDEKAAKGKKYPNDAYPKDKAERAALFEKAAAAVEFIGKKSTTFEGSVFPWCAQQLGATAPCGLMLGLAAYDRSAELTRRLAGFLPLMNSDHRLAFCSLLLDPEVPEQRAFLLEGLSDKSQTVRQRVVNRLGYYPLVATDAQRLTGALTTQNADLRKGIVTLLEQQKEALIRPVIDALLASQNKNQLIAGVELLEIFAKKNPALWGKYQEKISALDNVSQDVTILLEKSADVFTAENGYGLYDPRAEIFNQSAFATKRPPVPAIKGSDLKALIVPEEQAVFALYDRLIAVFYVNADYEYETENGLGTRENVLLGDNTHWIRPLEGWERHLDINAYPLAEKWLEAAGEFARDKRKLAAALSLWCGDNWHNKAYARWFRSLFAGYPIEAISSGLTVRLHSHIKLERFEHPHMVNGILQAIMCTGEADLFDFAFSAYVNLVRKIPESRLGDECEEETKNRQQYYHVPMGNRRVLMAEYLSYWRQLAHAHIQTDEQFEAWFNELWYEYLAAGQRAFYGLDNGDILRAHQLGLLPDDAMYLYFTGGAGAPEHIKTITGPYAGGRELLEKYPAAKAILEAAFDRIVTIEENRGELPTALTAAAAEINRFDGGAGHFVKLLAALGETGFNRGSSYSYFYNPGRGELTKKESLSKLLRCCRPTPEDTPETLRAAIMASKIPEKRVIQAAVYAPQWAGLLERAMEITGLKCGVWFFHAHVNESFSAAKETETAIYSAIEPQQFIDGAFDKDWFFQAYRALGEKRFNELYKNAKYITDSSVAHRRSQLYADAVLGRLDKDATRAEIAEKRHQEKLRAYALIPLAGENDALERYEFIQQYKKESRQFGSARQASEGKAAEVALDNLAITTGHGDAERMTWALEGAKIEQLRPLMEPHAIGETEVWLSIEEDGTPELMLRKNGKPLKTLPKELAKDTYVAELKEAVKQLREQKRRAKHSFEAAMIARSPFSAQEVIGLLDHPVLRGMAQSLVFKMGDQLGFPGELTLSADSLTIAHPHDLISRGVWSEYQQRLYREKIVQPFKQVFREYYPVTEDELASVNASRRYAGNQVQPKKTVALLKTRGWTVDYEEGLQRVWHRDNLIARMYAMADWFSPADIEAPTLETIQFYSRDKCEPVAFADIPAVIFSETMRDIDLAVSVAHVGGVDPEASHSTVEMRIAIARELLAMLTVSNVTFQTAHAQIKGSLGDYSVHMGSGVVHKSGTGMLAVLPVHSQARGRIFLPFADDDPKTAEILSKILLFADDRNIKDPGILGQIGRA